MCVLKWDTGWYVFFKSYLQKQISQHAILLSIVFVTLKPANLLFGKVNILFSYFKAIETWIKKSAK